MKNVLKFCNGFAVGWLFWNAEYLGIDRIIILIIAGSTFIALDNWDNNNDKI